MAHVGTRIIAKQNVAVCFTVVCTNADEINLPRV